LELLIKGKREKLTDEEIQKLIDDNYLEECSSTATGNAQSAMQAAHSKDQSVIFYNGKVYDERKRAVYGIQKSK